MKIIEEHGGPAEKRESDGGPIKKEAKMRFYKTVPGIPPDSLVTDTVNYYGTMTIEIRCASKRHVIPGYKDSLVDSRPLHVK